jgi:cupin fold WbuC family metalloprotein
MKEIFDADTLLARFGDINEVEKDWKFYNQPEEPLQYGVGVFQNSHKMQPHLHRTRDRNPRHKTNEFILVLEGKVKVVIYKINLEEATSEILLKGQWVAFHNSAHSMEVLMNNTRLLEVKNGPFVSVEEDKIKWGRIK